MGYYTSFRGEVRIEPPLSAAELRTVEKARLTWPDGTTEGGR